MTFHVAFKDELDGRRWTDFASTAYIVVCGQEIFELTWVCLSFLYGC